MSVSTQWVRRAAAGLIAAGLFVGVGSAAEIKVIYSKKAGHPTANIPGTKDLAGSPAASDWRAMEDFSVAPDGHRWMLKGRTQLGSDLETIMVLGSNESGSAFAQEGQPFLGAAADELYDFFDTISPASFDTLGNIAFSARARGGVTTDDEKLIYVDSGGTHTLILKQGDPALGLTDVAANPTGDELIGNSIGSVQIRETADLVQFVNTPITNCHSSRYPAMFRGNTGFRQSGVSIIDGEVWDTFDLSDAGGTPDGAHWYAEGDTENPDLNVDDILVVDDVVVIRQSSEVAGPGTPVMADIFQTQMCASGSWVSRGDDPLDNDWAVQDGVLVAKTGDPIINGSSENWGAVFSSIAGNSLGDWVLIGNTDSTDPATDNVLVLNGTHVIAREGDPVDLDGNGAFDDDAYIGRGNNTLSPFAANDLQLTDSRRIYVIIQLRDGAGNDITSNPVFGSPDAFVMIDVCPGDFDRDFDVDLGDLALLLAAYGSSVGDPGYDPLLDLDGSGSIDLPDLAVVLSVFGSTCP